MIFTDADLSSNVKAVDIEDYDDVPVEGQIWDVDRLFRVCCSEQGRQIIEIDFRQYCGEGIPCLEASSAATDQYSSYLGLFQARFLQTYMIGMEANFWKEMSALSYLLKLQSIKDQSNHLEYTADVLCVQ